jgi:hypothetical protein
MLGEYKCITKNQRHDSYLIVHYLIASPHWTYYIY